VRPERDGVEGAADSIKGDIFTHPMTE
jgi:hypothetical protein